MKTKSDELLEQIINHPTQEMTPEYRDLLFKYVEEKQKEKLIIETEKICNHGDFKI